MSSRRASARTYFLGVANCYLRRLGITEGLRNLFGARQAWDAFAKAVTMCKIAGVLQARANLERPGSRQLEDRMARARESG